MGPLFSTSATRVLPGTARPARRPWDRSSQLVPLGSYRAQLVQQDVHGATLLNQRHSGLTGHSSSSKTSMGPLFSTSATRVLPGTARPARRPWDRSSQLVPLGSYRAQLVQQDVHGTALLNQRHSGLTGNSSSSKTSMGPLFSTSATRVLPGTARPARRPWDRSSQLVPLGSYRAQLVQQDVHGTALLNQRHSGLTGHSSSSKTSMGPLFSTSATRVLPGTARPARRPWDRSSQPAPLGSYRAQLVQQDVHGATLLN